MNALIIINNAILANLYIEVAKHLQALGYNIYVATDSNFTFSKYKLDSFNFKKIYVFENYLDSLTSLKNVDVIYNNWNVHSDFDRNNYYRSVSGEGDFWGAVSAGLYSFFDEIYIENNINFVFYENVSNGLAETALKVGEQRKVHYLGLTSSRLPGRMLFTSDECRLAEQVKRVADRIDLTMLNEEEQEFVTSYLENIDRIQPDYMKTNGLSSINFVKRVFKKRDFRETLTSILYGFKKSNTFQMGNTLIKSYYFNKREINRTLCARWLKNKYTKSTTHDHFYLYPLHYHPESSTSILAKFYDEYEVIKNIAFSMPHGSYLFVKDHISANGYEGFEFYKKILKLPNVKLISPDENTKALIRNSLGVFTLTSTVGYEAVLLNKPVVVFGDVFYNQHPLAYRISGYRDLDKAFLFIKKFGANNHNDYNIKFVAAYYRLTFPLVVDYRIKGDAMINKGEEIAAIIHNKLQLSH